MSETLLLNSCKRDKPIVALKLLEIINNINNFGIIFKINNSFYKKIFNYKDIFGKTALNYAVANNMKYVALQILKLQKEYKKSDHLTNLMFDDPVTWTKIKVIPYKFDWNN